MTMTDPIADMLTRIRNALRVRRAEVTVPASRLRQAVADVLKREGFIKDYDVLPGEAQARLTLRLKYGPDGEDVITMIRRDSRPGRRLYGGVDHARRVLNGRGISIWSTPEGVLSDRECRQRGVGGERLATIW